MAACEESKYHQVSKCRATQRIPASLIAPLHFWHRKVISVRVVCAVCDSELIDRTRFSASTHLFQPWPVAAVESVESVEWSGASGASDPFLEDQSLWSMSMLRTSRTSRTSRRMPRIVTVPGKPSVESVSNELSRSPPPRCWIDLVALHASYCLSSSVPYSRLSSGSFTPHRHRKLAIDTENGTSRVDGVSPRAWPFRFHLHTCLDSPGDPSA